ncbi:MAG: dihydrodipicolinate synthase family protein [Pseudomonadota bacterium]
MRGSFGVSVALTTPFSESGEILPAPLAVHAKSVLEAGASSVTLYGTTGEGASIGAEEREIGLAALLSTQCPAQKIILGVCANALADAQTQIAEGLTHGVTRFLVPPPFFFTGTHDQAIFDWYAALLARTDREAQVILYHIPQLTQVSLSPDLVARLAEHAPDRVIAVKDSSGDWESARALIETQGLPVLVGDERLLHRAVSLGGAGSICGVANLYPERLVRVVQTAAEDPWISRLVDRVVSVPVIPGLKALMAERTGNPVWERPRLPLSPLSPEDRAKLFSEQASVVHG